MTQTKMSENHWRKRLPPKEQRTNPPVEKIYGAMREPYPYPPEDNFNWRLPPAEVKEGWCGMVRRVTLKTNHRLEVVCHLDRGHDLPHEGLHRWYSGAVQ